MLAQRSLELEKWCIILFLIFLLGIVLSVFLSKDAKEPASKEILLPSQILSIIAGAAILFFYGYILSSLPHMEKELSEKLRWILESTFGILASAVLLAVPISKICKKDLFQKIPILYVFPTLWVLFRLVERFLHYRAVANSNLEMLDVLVCGSFALYFFFQAKVLAEVEMTNNRKNLFIFGMFAVLASLVYSVSNIAKQLPDLSEGMSSLLPFIVDFILGIYIAAYLLGDTLTYREEKKEKSIEA
jgi:hypothetical protein